MPQIDRRTYMRGVGSGMAGASLAVTGCLGMGGGSDDEFPNDDVTAIVPFDSGGGFGAMSEVMAPYLSEYLPGGNAVSFEYHPGGGGLVGSELFWNSDPDGYTITHNFTIPLISHELYGDTDIRTRELSFIGLTSADPDCLVIREDLGIDTFDDYVDQIQDLTIATPGRASNGHLFPIFLGELTGSWSQDDLNFVHFDGTGGATQSVVTGESDAFHITAPTGYRLQESQDEIELAFVFVDSETGSRFADRTKQFSDDIDVSGLDDYESVSVFPRFLAGPPDVEEDRIEVLQDTYQSVIDDEEYMEEIMEVHMITNPVADGDAVLDIVEAQLDAFGQEPAASLLEEAI